MIKFPRKNVADTAGVEPATSWSLVGRASTWATVAGYLFLVKSGLYFIVMPVQWTLTNSVDLNQSTLFALNKWNTIKHGDNKK